MDDSLKRNIEKESGGEEFSPMDPPEAYSPPKMDKVDYEELHPFLQKLYDEHRNCEKQLEKFEKALVHIREEGINREVDKDLRDFFEFFDESIIKHNRKEEKQLFPILHQRLLENGEHSHGDNPTTAIDMLEDDHIKTIQMASVAFNFLGLSARLPEAQSRIIVLDVALEQGKDLVELLRLHIFREDNIVTPLAHKYVTSDELETMHQQAQA
jgi:hemerythrin-like domain-containing protein